MSSPNPSLPDSAPVTTVVNRTVKAGREAEFEKWLQGVSQVVAGFPGHLGMDVFRPPEGEREYVFIYRFDTWRNLRRWSDSRERMEWVARADALCDESHFQRITGLEHWFRMPSRHAPGAPPPPPRWKMAVLTWLAIYPLINVMNVALGPLIGAWHPLLRTLLTTAIMIPLMTWVIMPGMTRVFLRWIFPKAQTS